MKAFPSAPGVTPLGYSAAPFTSVATTSASFSDGLSATGTLTSIAGILIQSDPSSAGLYAEGSGASTGYGLMMISGAGVEKGMSRFGTSGSCAISSSWGRNEDSSEDSTGANVHRANVVLKKNTNEKKIIETIMTAVFLFEPGVMKYAVSFFMCCYYIIKIQNKEKSVIYLRSNSMEGHFHLFSFPKQLAASSRGALRQLESYFFVYYIDHFSDVPTGDVWQSAFGYAKEVSKILFTLARRAQSNVVLVGQEGVASLGVAKEVARQISTHPELKGSRVIFVNIEDLFLNVSSGMERLHAIAKVVSEAERIGNVIVVISGMSGVLAGKYSLTAEDVLHPFFASPSVRTVTILSDEEYHAHIAPSKELGHLVELVQIAALSAEHTRELLHTIFGSKVPHEVLDEVVRRTEGIFSHIPYPKRAVDIVQELIANNTLSKEHVSHHISKKVGFDIRRLEDAHSLHLEDAIRRHVINQKQALQEISHAMMRARGKSQDKKHPLASLLFVGPRGVGKGETAKAIAQTYFGSTKRVVKLHVEDIVEGLPRVITEHPFSVVVVEGLEEASHDAKESLRFVLSEGYITDRFGRKYFATHLIIIATTHGELHSEELTNSFDGVATFVPLTLKHVQEIARRMLARFNGRLQMEHNVSLEVTPGLIEYLAKKGYSQEFGAHAMKEVMQSTVEHDAMQAISRGRVVPGGKICINPREQSR